MTGFVVLLYYYFVHLALTLTRKVLEDVSATVLWGEEVM